MIVLGVDPGSVRTGWGLVRRVGPRLQGVAAGVITAGSDAPFPERLATIYDGLCAVIREHAPAVMAVEDVFYARFAAAAIKLGHARGVILLAAAHHGLEVHSYPPAQVKRSVAGRGQAPKEQVARLMGAMLGWTELPGIDATDALAVAITHLNGHAVAQAAMASASRSAPRRTARPTRPARQQKC